MTSEYDPTVDALYIRLADARVVESEELRPGFIVDLDSEGRIVGVEILDASKHVAPGGELDRPRAA
ncbi:MULTISPECIES: DUF2283 domain-containing protein [Methylobacterium]|jgi:uncharacterized protein YuzE|uniref:DUF2283 domain-containing protein n=1 Tax=Methylobacterium TaxID=407 RepID=UPI0011C96751|nr:MULTISPECIES: DUF2283 domain-containing protein [Methylobacterium]TXN47799.1 DUF2283 domain-containing protein [Methylobacterium sp. WL7]TXN55745.1 DUF2283 domain-containing protein [Methylobacterium sp. WL18]GJE22504.1 hypothetical protein JHFBIEKO_2959 [Methylobacterium mesophilicum]